MDIDTRRTTLKNPSSELDTKEGRKKDTLNKSKQNLMPHVERITKIHVNREVMS